MKRRTVDAPHRAPHPAPQPTALSPAPRPAPAQRWMSISTALRQCCG